MTSLREYGNLFHYGYSGGMGSAVPVNDEAFFQYLEESGIQPDTVASVRAAVERIDSAKVYSDLDQDTGVLQRPAPGSALNKSLPFRWTGP